MSHHSAASFIIGKRYQVPCIELLRDCLFLESGTVLPVLGPLHEDKAIIGFVDQHWHIDFRFVSAKVWREWDDGYRGHANVHGSVISAQNVLCGADGVFTQWRKCRRPMPSFPTEYIPRGAWRGDAVPVPWLPNLEAAYSDHRIKPNCAVCLHRGLPLVGIAPDRDGVIVCLGHVLAWNTTTGELVRRTEQPSRSRS